MPSHDFVFELRLEDRADAGALIADLTRRILHRLGFGAGAAGDISRPLCEAVDRFGPGCLVHYAARHGDLEITVTSDAQPPWRVARRIPEIR